MHHPNYNRASPPKPDITFKVFKIGRLVLLGLNLMSALGFYLVCNFLMKKSDEYERTFTELTGVFESPAPVKGPISGDETTVAYFEVRRSHGTTGPGRGYPSDEFGFLHYHEGTTFNANGKKYVLTGTQVHRFYGKKKYDPHTQQVSIYAFNERRRYHEEIPDRINGLDPRLDEYLNQVRSYTFFGTSSTLTVKEHLYLNQDTVTMRVHVRHDTIFLGNSRR